MVANALKRWWPTLLIYPETSKRDTPLIIQWRGIEYRIFCEEKK